MRRLYQKIYLVFLASLIAVVVISGLSWRIGQANFPHNEVLDLVGELTLTALAPGSKPETPPRRCLSSGQASMRQTSWREAWPEREAQLSVGIG